MTDAPKTAPDAAQGGDNNILKLAVDLGPVIIFVLVYNLSKSAVGDDAVFWATGVYMVAAVASIIVAKMTQDRLPPMLIITTIIVLVFGGLSLGFRLAGSEYADDFAYIKPTIINGLFATAIITSLLMGKNIWKIFFGAVFTLPERVWNIFAWRWSGFFIFLAVLNMVLAYAPPDLAFWINAEGMSAEDFAQARETFWANAKVALNIPLTIGFMLANYPLLAKHMPKDDTPAEV